MRRESENRFLQILAQEILGEYKQILVKIVRYIDYECKRIQRFSQRFSPNRFARIHLDSCSMSQISTPVIMHKIGLLFIWHQTFTKISKIQTCKYKVTKTPKSQNARITHKVFSEGKVLVTLHVTHFVQIYIYTNER